MPSPSPRVISYIRYSTAGQNLGDSEHRQLGLAEKYCLEHGLTLAPDDVRRDLGRSAFRKRTDGAFHEFLTALRAGAIQRGTILIVEAWDRISREPAVSALHQMTEIILAGIRIVTLIDKEEHDEATVNAHPHKLFHSLALIIAANVEFENKSKRLKSSYEFRRKLAVEGTAIISATTRKAWLDYDPKTKRFVPNEGAKTVKRIYQMAADGMGCFTIARRLEAEYRKTGQPEPLSGGRKSKGWNRSRIQDIIQSDAPMGVYHSHTMAKDGKTRIPGEKIEGHYPIVVEQSLANRARAQMKSRTFGQGGAKGALYTNLFTNGLAKCGSCGHNMILNNRHLKKQDNGYLRCSDALANSGCQNRSSIRYLDLENSVLRDVGWFQAIQKHMPRHDPSHELAEQIAEKEGQRKRIDDTLAAMLLSFGEKPLAAIADQMKVQAERRDAIDLELVELRQSHQIVAAKAAQPDHLSERDKLMAQAVSLEPQKRYEARARIAAGLRGTIESISCMPDKTTRVNFPIFPIIFGNPPFPAKTSTPTRTVRFSIAYDATMKTRALMTVDPPLDDMGKDMEITGFAPSLLIWALKKRLQSEGNFVG